MTPLSDQISKNDEIMELKLGLSRSKMERPQKNIDIPDFDTWDRPRSF